MKHSIKINDINHWMSTIAEIHSKEFGPKDEITIDLKGMIHDDFDASHMASIACIETSLHSKGVFFTWIGLLLVKEMLSHDHYLFKVDEELIEMITQDIHDNLKRLHYPNIDISAVKGCLNEALYNIFDHADAHGEAYMCISLDTYKDVISVGVCDFGIGVAKKIRTHYPDITEDTEALRKAIENSFTTQSKPHNRGYGLDNIISCCSEGNTFKLTSNGASLIVLNNKISTFALDYEFPGTLLYFEISISELPDDEDLFEDII